MKFVTDLSVTSAPHRGRMRWSPEALFAGSSEGAWFDPSDLATLFQNANGTIPVTASGQPVGRLEDKSGNGRHATQAIATARPTWRTNGTTSWLEFDGIDDRMVLPPIPYTFETFGLCIGLEYDPTDPFWASWRSTSDNTGAVLGRSLRLSAGAIRL